MKPPTKAVRVAWWILFALVIIVVVSIRIRLLQIPLERDEGEYAYAGQLMLQGIPPYQLAYNMKFPGTYAAYALIMAVLGENTIGIHLGLLAVNAATIALIFFLGRRLFGDVAGLAAAAVYAVLSISPDVFGFAAHASQFVMLPVLAGALLLLQALDRQSTWKLFASGFLFGLGVLMKQPGAAFVGFGFLYLLFHQRSRGLGLKETSIVAMKFVGAALLPFALMCLVLWQAGVFPRFWFWCVDYAREYGTRVSLSEGLKVFAFAFRNVVAMNWLIWLIAAAGLMLLALKNRDTRSKGFLVGLFIFGFLATSAGLYFRGHYFIFVLPAVSLLAGATVWHLSQFRIGRVLSPFLLIAALALPLIADRQFFFQLPMDACSRLAYGLNPFPESVPIADFLRERTTPEDTVAIIGSEPQIYFYAHRHSATGYIYTYPLMEPHPFAERMQQEMVRQIEAARPKFIVYVAYAGSWGAQPESKKILFDWFERYLANELKQVGLVNIVSPTETKYYLPYHFEPVDPSECQVTIYERKS